MDSFGNYKLKTLILSELGTNCYLLNNIINNEAILVDAGGDGEKIITYINNHNLVLKAVLLTHGHYDHIEAVDKLWETYADLKIFANIDEKVVIEDRQKSLMPHNLNENSQNATTYIKDGDNINIIGLNIKMISTPGHTIGCACYYIESLKILFSGDTLFFETYGRTDLPTGNFETIAQSINSKLMNLPNEVKVFPGHGFSTTIGHEREYNDIIKEY